MKKIEIDNIRGIKHLSFEIPGPGLHIITGTNGSGKTTLFTCISRIYDRNAYRNGFASSDKENLDRFSGTITYTTDKGTVTYSKKDNHRWRPKPKKAQALEGFAYPKIINISTTNDRLFTQEDIEPKDKPKANTWLNNQLNTVFHTDKFTGMLQTKTGSIKGRGGTANRHKIAYLIPKSDGTSYSERNFSLGEKVLINMLYEIEKAGEDTLVLIDEMELALHPSAQIELLKILERVAREKQLTVLVSTHSSSVIRSQKKVIFLDIATDGEVNVIYDCPPAKAIGAIGMREDTNPDIMVVVEDKMARCLFFALQKKYCIYNNNANYLDIRIIDIGNYHSAVKFVNQAIETAFYRNVYVAAFLDNDVKTDNVHYPHFANKAFIADYRKHESYIHFLPYTPEVLLVKTLCACKSNLLKSLRNEYCNQQIDYVFEEKIDLSNYNNLFPAFESKESYDAFVHQRSEIREKCKKQSEKIVEKIAEQVNQHPDTINRFIFKFAVDQFEPAEFNVRALLAKVMKRERPR